MPEQQFVARIEAIDGIIDPNLVPRSKGHGLALQASGGCPVGGQSYPDGSSICFAGRVWTCQGGRWNGPGAPC